MTDDRPTPDPPDTAPDDLLVRLADEATRKAKEVASRQELLTPVLVFADGEGRVQRVLISTPHVHPADVMKVILQVSGATHAAICFEGWAVEVAPDSPAEDAAWKRAAFSGRRPAGIGRPREHPDRFDVLYLAAQTRDRPAAGPIHRRWRIQDGSPRTFTEDDSLLEAFHAPSNFWPLFVEYPLVRELLRRHAVLVGLRDTIRRERRGGLDG